MTEVKKYYLPPTALVPNSPRPLLHYTGTRLPNANSRAAEFHDLFEAHGWAVHWIFRYGQTQQAHYHSGVHECMAILSGTATIRFGVADTSSDMNENTTGSGWEEGGLELEVQAGDVLLLPAGLAHKTYNAKPEAEFALLTPGNSHGSIAARYPRAVLDSIDISGFTMIGAYPMNGEDWDFRTGGEDLGEFQKIWSIEKPENDPVLGQSEDGLCGLWL